MSRTCFYALLTVSVVAASNCGGESTPRPAATPAVVDAARPGCAAGSFRRLETTDRAWGAAARRRLAAYDRPGGTPVARFGRLNQNGVPTIFGVVGARVDATCRPSWLRVRMPRRPNGRLGWVRSSDVTLERVRTRILVDLSSRRVTLYRDGRKVLTTRAAVGSASTPTPTGTFYVDQRLRLSDPRGPFGPGAVGVAAYSNVLTGWTQGGPIAIHGTNRPDLIGHAVSNGCVRVRNDVLLRLFRASLAGTPVAIQR